MRRSTRRSRDQETTAGRPDHDVACACAARATAGTLLGVQRRSRSSPAATTARLSTPHELGGGVRADPGLVEPCRESLVPP